jgi:hypothetical protein
MRKRSEIEADGKRQDLLRLEVLLDIRDLLTKQKKQALSAPKAKRGRPKKEKKHGNDSKAQFP